jgi:hypothetical protein
MCTVSIRVRRRGATALAHKDLLGKGGLVALSFISASLLHSLTDDSTVAIRADSIVHNELLAMCFAILAHRVAVRSVGVRSVLVRSVLVVLVRVVLVRVVLVMAVVSVTPTTATATA